MGQTISKNTPNSEHNPTTKEEVNTSPRKTKLQVQHTYVHARQKDFIVKWDPEHRLVISTTDGQALLSLLQKGPFIHHLKNRSFIFKDESVVEVPVPMEKVETTSLDASSQDFEMGMLSTEDLRAVTAEVAHLFRDELLVKTEERESNNKDLLEGASSGQPIEEQEDLQLCYIPQLLPTRQHPMWDDDE